MSRLPNQMGQTSVTCCVDLQDADEAVDEAFASLPDADAMVAYQASADGAVLGEKKKVRKQQRLHMHGHQCVDGCSHVEAGLCMARALRRSARHARSNVLHSHADGLGMQLKHATLCRKRRRRSILRQPQPLRYEVIS